MIAIGAAHAAHPNVFHNRRSVRCCELNLKNFVVKRSSASYRRLNWFCNEQVRAAPGDAAETFSGFVLELQNILIEVAMCDVFW
jgi:hypothetical protein